jgi:hypothetical protein
MIGPSVAQLRANGGFAMNLTDEMTGHVPDDLASEIDDTELSDEALDRHSEIGLSCNCYSTHHKPERD